MRGRAKTRSSSISIHLRDLRASQFKLICPPTTPTDTDECNPGQADHTADRHAWLDSLTLAEIESSIRQRREAS